MAVLELTAHWPPDVIVMDGSMPPVLSGPEATRWICATWPKVKVIAPSMYDGRPCVAAMLQAGARAYLLQDVPSDDLAAPVRAVAQGQTCIRPAVKAGPATSPRELR